MIEEGSGWEPLLHLLAGIWDAGGQQSDQPLPRSSVDQAARAQAIIPTLYPLIQQSGVVLPSAIGQAWEQIYYRAAAANTYHLHDLERVVTALSALESPLLILKGAAFADALYGDVTLRQMGDLDLVVPRQQVLACQEVLLGLEFDPVATEITPGSNLAYRNEVAFSPGEAFHTPVELHWHLIDIPYYLRAISMDWFWENTQAHSIGSQPVKVLNPEANLLYLPMHLALHHRFRGLRWFVDLALLIHKHQDTLDWDKVIRKAQEFELLLVLRETLNRLADYWPSLPIAESRRQLRALEPTPFEERLYHLLTAEPRSPLLDFYTDIICLPNLPARMHFALSNLFPQQAYMAQRYGVERSWQLPYWYLYRIGDGLVKMARTLPQVLELG